MASASTIPPRSVAIDGPLSRGIPLHMPHNVPPGASQGDPMDTSSGRSMAPPLSHPMGNSEMPPNDVSATTGGAAVAGQQPKVVQTAFIHKLYNMLEDNTIQHLITWSSSKDSFLITPTAEFSKVLATYFKHTNVSSFVRQLNMYGFHKVSDVFHSGSPESPLWEFKHGNGSFRRGDFAGLKEIKRRASRHALIHRDSFPTAPKPQNMVMGPPAEPVTDPIEARLNMLEHSMYDVHARLARSEESNLFMATRCQMLSDNLIKCYQYNHDLSSAILNIAKDPENSIHRDVVNMQIEINRKLEVMRNADNTQPNENRLQQHSFAPPPFENGLPMSPFQLAQDDQRRASMFNNPRAGFSRPPMPHRTHTTSGLRAHSPPSRSALQTSLEPPTPPVSDQIINPSISSPPTYLSRRHTSADIRQQPGWPPSMNSNEHLPLPAAPQSPFASGQSSANWPSSPNRTPNHTHSGEQQLRDSLARYQFSNANTRSPMSNTSSGPANRGPGSRAHTPPPPTQNESSNGVLQTIPLHNGTVTGSGGGDVIGAGWSGFSGPRMAFKDVFGSSGPPTRRGSVAHLLNPADTAERDDEEDIGPDELRKRKRLG